MKDELEVFFESTDAAREGEVSVKTVRLDAEAGRLPVCALTRRGVRLFRESDVRRWAAGRYAARPSSHRDLAVEVAVDKGT